MILNVKSYSLLDEIDLSKNEMKLVLLLSDNEYHSAKECLDYIGIYSHANLYSLINKINKNKELITHKKRIGYRIKEKIKIDH